MTPASKAAPAKKAPASRTAAAKKAAPAKKVVSAKATPAPKKGVVATAKGIARKVVSTAVPVAKKSTPVAKKAAPAAKKAAPPAKKAAPAAAKKAPAEKAPAAKKAAPTKKAAAAAVAEAAAVEASAAPPRTTFIPRPKPPAPVKPETGPYAKDEKFLEEVLELLAEERAIYQEQATSLRAEADSLALEREPGDVQFDEESGEGGTITVDRERNLALSGQAALAVEEIDFAYERIEGKTYGYCERCFQPIPKPRLRALPYARLCVACKSGGLSRR
jgi:RNA polymerase-binding transcription factor DksA